MTEGVRSLVSETSSLPVLGGLRHIALGATPERAKLAVVLCHGYASSADDLLPIAKAAMEIEPRVAEDVRFYFPAGVVDLGDPVRGWWPVGETQEALAGKDYASLRDRVYMGSSGARRAFAPFVEAALRECELGTARLVLGGFSQGGMLATDTALRSSETPAGLIVMSSMTMSESRWRELAPTRAGMRVMITHGTRDPLLDLAEANHLSRLFEQAGLPVDLHTFDGPHTVDLSSASAIGRWLRGLLEP